MTDHDGGRGDVAIVGAGLIGLFSAHYLVERGHTVTLFDSGGLGGGAARVNAGWVCPARSDPLPSYSVVRDGVRSLVSRESGSFFLSPWATPRVAGYLARFLRNSASAVHARAWDDLDVLNSRTAALVDELADEGIIADLQDEGFLMLHSTKEEAEASRASLQAVARRGLCPRPEPVRGRDALIELEPGLGPAARWGFVHRGDRWLDPSRLVDKLSESLAERGARLVPGTPVIAVRPGDRGVEIETSRGSAEATHAVIAAGVWSEALLRPLGVRGFVVPGKGYSFTVTPAHPPTHVLRLGKTHVGVTPLGERARVAGIVEFDGTFDALHEERIAGLKRRAAPYLSGIDWDASTEECAAPRPMTPDGKPLIGCVPGAERVIIATGHNMLGLSLGAATGAVVADLVEHGSAAGPGAFDPMRFAPWWRRVADRS